MTESCFARRVTLFVTSACRCDAVFRAAPAGHGAAAVPAVPAEPRQCAGDGGSHTAGLAAPGQCEMS